ncbi:unnamed protein product [Calypogeia fissa]
MEQVVSGPEANSNNYYEELLDSIKPKMTNVVSGFNIGVQVDPNQIARKAMNAEYNPKRFNAVIMRIREPKATALIFPSGRLIVTGAKNEDDSKLACRKVARILQKLGYRTKFTDWKVINMVGMIEFPFAINLARLHHHPSLNGQWEPELFPALIGKILKPKITLLIFSSGKVVLLGFTQRQDLDTALHKLLPVLLEFKRDY